MLSYAFAHPEYVVSSRSCRFSLKAVDRIINLIAVFCYLSVPQTFARQCVKWLQALCPPRYRFRHCLHCFNMPIIQKGQSYLYVKNCTWEQIGHIIKQYHCRFLFVAAVKHTAIARAWERRSLSVSIRHARPHAQGPLQSNCSPN